MRDATCHGVDERRAKPQAWAAARRRGSAMTETVVTLPLILLLLALMVYFGVSLQRLQRVTAAGRYESWRQMDDGVHNAAAELIDEDRINEQFFSGKAASVDVQVSFGETTEANDLLDAALVSAGAQNGNMDVDSARDWMDKMLSEAPGTRGVGVEASFDATSMGMLSSFDGPMRHHTVVLDGDWRYAPWLRYGSTAGRDVVWPVIHEVFYDELAALFEPLANGGNEVAEASWDLHEVVSDARGPDELPWWSGSGMR